MRSVKPDSHAALRVTHCDPIPRVTSREMAEQRGHPVIVPDWWIDDLDAQMRAAGLRGIYDRGGPAALAAHLAGTDDRESPRFKSAKTLVSRFMTGQHRTIETVAEIRKRFPSLRQIVFVPASREEAERLEATTGDAGSAALLQRIEESEQRLLRRIDERLSALGRTGTPKRTRRRNGSITPKG